MVSLVGYASNNRIRLFCVFVAIVRVEAFDLTSELRLDDRYCDLPLVRDVKPGHAYSDARLFYVATQMTF
jgi:hypothetical protein